MSWYTNPNNRQAPVTPAATPSGADLVDAQQRRAGEQSAEQARNDELEQRRKVREATNRMRRTLRLPPLPDDAA